MSTATEDTVSVDWRSRILKVNGMVPIMLILLGGVLWFGAQIISRYVDGSVNTQPALDKQTAIISQEHKALSGEHQELIQTQNRIAETLEVQTFLMTKGDKERQSYELDVPAGLRKASRAK